MSSRPAPREPLLTSRRRSLIMERLNAEGSVQIGDLSSFLQVSPMTIRRDLQQLDQEGLLRRVRGGAMPVRGRPFGAVAATPSPQLPRVEPAFADKLQVMLPRKQAIARAAAALVRPGAVVGLSGGTTPFQIALALKDLRDVTVVTNSLPVTQAFDTRNPGTQVVLTGGLHTPTDAVVGPIAVRALSGLHVDRLFLGAQGVDPVAGLTGPSMAEAETNRALMGCARRVCLVFDSSKWDVRALYTFAPWSAIDEAICDDGLPDAARELIVQQGVHLTVVPESVVGALPEPDELGRPPRL